jgi:hypothetical protein
MGIIIIGKPLSILGHSFVYPNPKESVNFSRIRIQKKNSDSDPDTVIKIQIFVKLEREITYLFLLQNFFLLYRFKEKNTYERHLFLKISGQNINLRIRIRIRKNKLVDPKQNTNPKKTFRIHNTTGAELLRTGVQKGNYNHN